MRTCAIVTNPNAGIWKTLGFISFQLNLYKDIPRNLYMHAAGGCVDVHGGHLGVLTRSGGPTVSYTPGYITSMGYGTNYGTRRTRFRDMFAFIIDTNRIFWTGGFARTLSTGSKQVQPPCLLTDPSLGGNLRNLCVCSVSVVLDRRIKTLLPK